MLPPRKVAHDQAEIAAAFTGALADGADLLLFAGASAVVDRGDIGPAAIVAAGGAITHFGMPVDPGNLICLGRIAATPAIVMPGCARSPRLNGIDLILRLICAGEPAGSAEITAMGAGGLLQEARPRPVPRSGRGGAKPPAPRFAAIVLAAGLSSRMAPRNKLLLADSSGRAMVARVVAACAASGVDQVVIVLGHQADAVERVIQAQAAERVGTGPKLRIARAPNYRAGLSESLRAGIAALDSDITAAMICLGDMPLVTAGIIDSMLAAYDPDQGRAIVVPTCRGQRGNPVLWDRRFFPEIAALSGDTGARGLLRLHGGAVHEIELGTDAVLLDFDTPESLSGAGQRGLC
jgi:molybdenum cofactor cytidylyltransferase